MYNESNLLEKLKNGSYNAFTVLFKRYYKDLVLFAGSFLQNQQVCEDIVQNIFLHLWSNRETFSVKSSLKSFLLRSVQNACIDEFRHNKVKQEHVNFIEVFGSHSETYTENYILYSEIKEHINKAINNLPEDYKTAFIMHRFEGYKYREIAVKLNVTERVVEGRIVRSLAILRKMLKEFAPSLVFFFLGL